MLRNEHASRCSRLFTFSIFFVLCFSFFATVGLLNGQTVANLKEAPQYLGADSRFKADILLIVAHPDDEQMVAPYLARAIDEHKRVAVLYTTCGISGGNSVGSARETALCLEREIEARRAVGYLGITNAWFIGAPDTPSANPLWSFERWNHGAALDYAVRVVRLTRPEVIISMLPDIMTGENHGDHQAAGIIATEAFDMAGNPTVFPEQIGFPTPSSYGTMNTEGLQPWQPEKLYFEANPHDTDWMKGQGPSYSTTDVSPARHLPYYMLAANSLSYHLTQGAGSVKEAIASGHLSRFEHPVQLLFGKSVVGGSATGDVFENVMPGPIPFVRTPGYQPASHSGVSLELGDPMAFYRKWWPAHNLERLARLMPEPEMGVTPGGTLPVPLIIHNDTNEPAQVDLTADLPPGWTEIAGSARYPVPAHGAYPVRALLKAPAKGVGEWQQIAWHAAAGGQQTGSVKIKVLLEAHSGMPQ